MVGAADRGCRAELFVQRRPHHHESGLRIYKELAPMKKDQVDLENKIIWIPIPRRRTV
jgi:hypothetical protein